MGEFREIGRAFHALRDQLMLKLPRDFSRTLEPLVRSCFYLFSPVERNSKHATALGRRLFLQCFCSIMFGVRDQASGEGIDFQLLESSLNYHFVIQI